MARKATSPIPKLISNEVLQQYKGVSLRIVKGNVYVAYRHPLSGATTRAAGTTREEILTSIENAYKLLTGETKKVGATTARFGDITKEWSTEVLSKKRHSTQVSYKTCANKWLVPKFRNRTITTITKPELAGFLNAVLKESKSPDTYNRLLWVLRGVFAYAEQKGYVLFDPTQGLKTAKTEKGKQSQDYLTVEEVNALIESLPNIKHGEWYRPHLLTLSFTGLRISELAGVRVQDIHFLEDGTASITVDNNLYEGVDGDPKSEAGRRTVYLVPRVAASVRGLLAASEGTYVFVTTTGAKLRATNFRRRVFNPLVSYCLSKGLVKQHGNKSITPHTLRHSYLTIVANSGVPANVLAAIAGHADVKTTYARYVAKDDSALKAAAAKAGEAFH